ESPRMAQHDTPSQQSSSAAPSSGMPVGSPYSRRMPDLHAARRALCQQKIAALGADAALITNLINVRYLTGLASSNAALLLPADGHGVLATDSRYAPAAARDCPDVELLARACAITCAALDEVVPQLRPGTTERQFAISLERAMTDLGAEAPA